MNINSDESSNATSNNTTFYTNNLSFLPWLLDEANTVKKITEKNQKSIDKAYEELLKQIHKSGTVLIQRRQDKCNIANNEDSLKNECTEEEILNKIGKTIKITAIMQDYEEKISDITLLKTTETNSYTDCKSRIRAYKKAIEYFEKVFGINIIYGKTNEHEIIIRMVFGGFEQFPVTLVFNRDIQIKSFHVKASNNEKYSELEKWFKTPDTNPVKLIIKLKKYVTNLI